MINTAMSRTTASTEKLEIAASLQTSDLSSVNVQVLHEGVFGYCLHVEQDTHWSMSELQNSLLVHRLCPFTPFSFTIVAMISPQSAQRMYEAIVLV